MDGKCESGIGYKRHKASIIYLGRTFPASTGMTSQNCFNRNKNPKFVVCLNLLSTEAGVRKIF